MSISGQPMSKVSDSRTCLLIASFLCLTIKTTHRQCSQNHISTYINVILLHCFHDVFRTSKFRQLSVKSNENQTCILYQLFYYTILPSVTSHLANVPGSELQPWTVTLIWDGLKYHRITNRPILVVNYSRTHSLTSQTVQWSFVLQAHDIGE